MEHSRLAGLVVDNPRDCIFRVHRDAYVSCEILELEWQRIFDRSWLYVGHESEVPGPGDFRTRDVAGRPLILCRDSAGALRVLINSCTHRGAQVCRERQGNARSFQCFYHAWTYSNAGDLIGVPDAAGYAPDFRQQELGLKAPPRVVNYRGLVFVSFDPAIEEFTDYLAGAREYLDVILDLSETGMEVVGGEHQYSINANWKMQVENTVDDYHVAPLHSTYLKYLEQINGVAGPGLIGRAYDLGNGHSVMERPLPGSRPIARWEPRLGEQVRLELEAVRQRLVERFGKERAEKMANLDRNLVIYPNLMILDIWGTAFRICWPLAADEMQVTVWTFGPRGEQASWRRYRHDNLVSFLGPGGLGTVDDIEAMESCQRGFRAATEVSWCEFSRGMNRPALVTDEETLRAFWRRWHRQITGSGQRRSRRHRPSARTAVGADSEIRG
jgi:p-cumate 2,3-dioxygenase alpha subunit